MASPILASGSGWACPTASLTWASFGKKKVEGTGRGEPRSAGCSTKRSWEECMTMEQATREERKTVVVEQ